MRTTKIYVGNLPQNVDNAELLGMFEKHGKVKECDVVRNYAFVHMENEEEAKVAIAALHNSIYNDSKISVEISHSKVRQRPGMGGKGQCYRCGRNGHWSKECPRNPAARMGGPIGGRSNGGGPAPLMYPTAYGDRYSRYAMDRPYGMERSYVDRSFSERMRPYPDPYERRPMPVAQDDYMYYRRPYDNYSYTRRTPPPPQPQPMPTRYDFSQDPDNLFCSWQVRSHDVAMPIETTFQSAERLPPSGLRAPVY